MARVNLSLLESSDKYNGIWDGCVESNFYYDCNVPDPAELNREKPTYNWQLFSQEGRWNNRNIQGKGMS